jgi:hypothetical protein
VCTGLLMKTCQPVSKSEDLIVLKANSRNGKICQRVLGSHGVQRFHASTLYLLIERYGPWSKAT